MRIELDVKHMLAGRNSTSIDFNGVENADESRRPEFKKSEKVTKNEKLILSYFLGLEARKTFS